MMKFSNEQKIDTNIKYQNQPENVAEIAHLLVRIRKLDICGLNNLNIMVLPRLKNLIHLTPYSLKWTYLTSLTTSMFKFSFLKLHCFDLYRCFFSLIFSKPMLTCNIRFKNIVKSLFGLL